MALQRIGNNDQNRIFYVNQFIISGPVTNTRDTSLSILPLGNSLHLFLLLHSI